MGWSIFSSHWWSYLRYDQGTRSCLWWDRRGTIPLIQYSYPVGNSRGSCLNGCGSMNEFTLRNLGVLYRICWAAISNSVWAVLESSSSLAGIRLWRRRRKKRKKERLPQSSAALLVSCAPRWRESLFPVARLAYRWLRVLVTVIRREGATLGRFPRA